MLRYAETLIVFKEVPDEITLAINITGCPVKCKGCHSKHLWENTGETLDFESLEKLIESNRGITCVAFMGGDADPKSVSELSRHIKSKYGLKTCWYSGQTTQQAEKYAFSFDFLKTGPYDETYGPLDSKTTNQRFYRISYNPFSESKELNDITYKFHDKVSN